MSGNKPFNRCYGWTNSVLQLRGPTTKAQRRGVLKRKRERWPLPGMMLLPDGSKCAWSPAGGGRSFSSV